MVCMLRAHARELLWCVQVFVFVFVRTNGVPTHDVYSRLVVQTPAPHMCRRLPADII